MPVLQLVCARLQRRRCPSSPRRGASGLFSQIALGALLLAFGGSWVIWGMFAGVVFTIHATGLANSVVHNFGYQPYRTRDRSRNNWRVAMLTWADGRRNNHHAFPQWRAGW
jgi:fatty-acid desaturase